MKQPEPTAGEVTRTLARVQRGAELHVLESAALLAARGEALDWLTSGGRRECTTPGSRPRVALYDSRTAPNGCLPIGVPDWSGPRPTSLALLVLALLCAAGMLLAVMNAQPDTTPLPRRRHKR